MRVRIAALGGRRRLCWLRAGTDPGGTIGFVNGSDVAVDVVYVSVEGREVVLARRIDPGLASSSIEVGPCIGPLLVARSHAGVEVDRLDRRLCRGETWGIGEEGH